MVAAAPLGIDMSRLPIVLAASLALMPALAAGALHVVVVDFLIAERRAAATGTQ